MNRKTEKRNLRLLSAIKWTRIYSGSNIVKGYSKKYGVDKICAIKELRMIGIQISDEYEKQLRHSIEELKKMKKLRTAIKEKELKSLFEWESDENFEVIIGYTSGGFPYGIPYNEENQ